MKPTPNNLKHLLITYMLSIQGGFDTFWEFTKSQIGVQLRQITDSVQPVNPSCQEASGSNKGWSCTTCVCTYRNKMVEAGMESVNQALAIAKAQAKSMFNVDLDEYINQYNTETLLPWHTSNSCNHPDNQVSSTNPK